MPSGVLKKVNSKVGVSVWKKNKPIFMITVIRFVVEKEAIKDSERDRIAGGILYRPDKNEITTGSSVCFARA